MTLIQSGSRLLNGYHAKVSDIAEKTMTEQGVEVLLNHRVKSVEEVRARLLDLCYIC